VRKLAFNYHIPISNTATGVIAFEVEGEGGQCATQDAAQPHAA
jgi:hypothetical protein